MNPPWNKQLWHTEDDCNVCGPRIPQIVVLRSTDCCFYRKHSLGAASWSMSHHRMIASEAEMPSSVGILYGIVILSLRCYRTYFILVSASTESNVFNWRGHFSTKSYFSFRFQLDSFQLNSQLSRLFSHFFPLFRYVIIFCLLFRICAVAIKTNTAQIM